jgi:hypothetical protein
MITHSDYHYGVTIKTSDEGILNCLRALSQYAQRTGNKRIPWGGTKKSDWIRDRHCVTFFFSDSEYRKSFMSEISRLLPNALWEKVGEDDNNIPIRQS